MIKRFFSYYLPHKKLFIIDFSLDLTICPDLSSRNSICYTALTAGLINYYFERTQDNKEKETIRT